MENFDTLLLFAIIGMGATLVMDIWALILRWLWKIPSMDYSLVGRWFGHLLSGVISHRQIGSAAVIPHEKWKGWAIHYLTGVIFSVSFGIVVGSSWLEEPQILSAVLFGIITLIFPFFALQPAFGAGVAASKTPRPTIARLKSLSAHSSFGIGLYFSALIINLV